MITSNQNILYVSIQEQWSSNVVDRASAFIKVVIAVQEQDGVDRVDYSREVSQTSENQTNEELNLCIIKHKKTIISLGKINKFYFLVP